MIKKAPFKLLRRLREESGQALIAVLALLLIGSLTLPPVLSHLGTSLKSGRIYTAKTDQLYAADSGVEDAIWEIKYDRLEVMFDSPAYDTYDYETTWSYDLTEPINGLTTNVTIQNVWIPKDVTPPAPDDARDIAESGKLLVAGTATTATNYRIKIDFYPGAGEEDDLLVDSLGIWLPLGFSYVADSSNLEEEPSEEYYSVPTISDYAGGQAVVWNFSSANFTYFPGVGLTDYPQSTEIRFEYTASEPGASPVAISWMETSGVSDVPVSWDIDTRIFKIVSSAGGTEIEAYASRSELRKMDAAIAGDYRAIGNSLMQDNDFPYDRRDTLISESATEISDIPSDADVIAAYLYWSGWIDSGFTQTIWYDNCSDLDDWTQTGSDWSISSGKFSGHHTGGEPDRYLEMSGNVDLSSYASGSAVVEWDQSDGGTLESSDGLQFQFSGDGGTSWSDNMTTAFMDDISSQYFYYVIPDEYLTSQFRMRFYLADMSASGEYAYIDNFAVAEITGTADTSAVFKINDVQVYLDGGGEPQQGAQEIAATSAQVIGNKNRGEYSYASYLDVTKLVKEYSDLGDDDNPTGNGEYTVGSVDADTGDYWSYAGWSLIVVFSSPETAGHQLYLFDTFAFSGGDENLDFDGDGEPGGDISGFVVPEAIEGEVNAATLTCFVGEGDSNYSGDYLIFNGTALSDGFSTNNVWNGQSTGMSEPGVDVDTFYVTWESGLLAADDTEAHIDLPSGTDNWNLIYMILSLRSETVTGSTAHYVIH